MERFDVAIVGAGPAGSSAAISLMRKGYSVLLADRSLFPREKLCGDFLNPVSWPIFERLGIADKLLESGHEKVTTFRMTSFSGEEVAFGFSSQKKHPFGLGFRRFHLDYLLLSQAESEGATVKQGCKVIGLNRERCGWSIILSNHSKEEEIHAKILVGADGRNSWVAHRLGLGQPSEKRGQYLAFQFHLRHVKDLRGEVQIHIFPGGYAGLVGLGGEIANLCFTVEKGRVKKGLSMESLFENCLNKNPRLKELLRASEFVGTARSTYPVYFAPRLLCGDGFLLVGDAARVTEPVTGEGVYFALKSGELATEAIDLAFAEGDLTARQMSSYRHACQAAFALRQRVNDLIRALVYRPSLLTPLIRLSARAHFPIGSFVDLVCG
jgi:geranylgeranyl reductase family protein